MGHPHWTTHTTPAGTLIVTSGQAHFCRFFAWLVVVYAGVRQHAQIDEAKGPRIQTAMTDFGHIHAVSITNRSGSIVYERFFDRLSEIQKAELRTALGQCSRDVARMANGHVGVGNFRYMPTIFVFTQDGACTGSNVQHMRRGATIVFQPFDSLVFFGVGSGEYDELTRMQSPISLCLYAKRGSPFETFRRSAVLSVMQSLVMSLKTVLKGNPTEQLVMAKYEKVCLVVDEIIHEVRMLLVPCIYNVTC